MISQILIVVLIGIICFLCGFILFEKRVRNKGKSEQSFILKSEIGDICVNKNNDDLITINFSDNNGGYSFIGDKNSIQQCKTIEGKLIDYTVNSTEVKKDGNEE